MFKSKPIAPPQLQHRCRVRRTLLIWLNSFTFCSMKRRHKRKDTRIEPGGDEYYLWCYACVQNSLRPFILLLLRSFHTTAADTVTLREVEIP